MIDINTREWIKYYVEEYYDSDESMDSAISLLDEYLNYIHDTFNDSYGMNLLDIAAANDIKKRALIKSFVDVEAFMGRMGSVLNLKTDDRLKPLYNNDPKEWTLAHLLKQAFCIFKENDNLKKLSSSDALRERYAQIVNKGLLKYEKKYHYLNVYAFRNNSGAHFRDDDNIARFTKKEIDGLISSMLIVILDLCTRFDSDLKIVYEKKEEQNLKNAYDATRYAQAIEQEYIAECNLGFEYLDTFWDVSSAEFEEKRNIQTFASTEEAAVTLFLGEAGTGKTTALRRLEFLFAQKCQKNHGQQSIPIYIELKSLRPISTPIRVEIGSRLKYGLEIVSQMLKDRSVILLLDGWNEIRSKEVMNLVRDELQGLIENYDLRVFVTDRSDKDLQLITMKRVNKWYLHELSYDDKREYFSKNCKSDAIELLLQEIDREEGGATAVTPVFNLKTPLMLYYFLNVVESENTIPTNPITRYIELLFEREEKEQKDADDPQHFDEMKYILASLSVVYQSGEFFTSDALVTIGRTKQLFGFLQPDSMQCLELSCKMGLLDRDDDIIRFRTSEFQDYFQNYAMIHGIDDKVQELA